MLSPFEEHCWLGRPSISVLKSLDLQFQDLSSLNCESCQFAKFHLLSLYPRVNERASAILELVHSNA